MIKNVVLLIICLRSEKRNGKNEKILLKLLRKTKMAVKKAISIRFEMTFNFFLELHLRFFPFR